VYLCNLEHKYFRNRPFQHNHWKKVLSVIKKYRVPKSKLKKLSSYEFRLTATVAPSHVKSIGLTTENDHFFRGFLLHLRGKVFEDVSVTLYGQQERTRKRYLPLN
jgi:hypothetical protein